MKLFASFVVKNALNVIFGPNKYIYSVESMIFIKKDKKKMKFFENVWRNQQIFEFLRENFPKLAKILKLYKKFWRVTLKNVKMLLKN